MTMENQQLEDVSPIILMVICHCHVGFFRLVHIIHIQLGCLDAHSARHGHRLATGTLLRPGLAHNAEMLGSKVEFSGLWEVWEVWWLTGYPPVI